MPPSEEAAEKEPALGEGRIEAAMLALVVARGADKTICPSEVARQLGGPRPDDWRRLMAAVRRVAVRLAREGKVVMLRKGEPVDDPDTLRGVYRIGLGFKGVGNDEPGVG